MTIIFENFKTAICHCFCFLVVASLQMKMTQSVVLKCIQVKILFAILNQMFEYTLVLFVVVDWVLVIFEQLILFEFEIGRLMIYNSNLHYIDVRI
jgi:hypothetical protein